MIVTLSEVYTPFLYFTSIVILYFSFVSDLFSTYTLEIDFIKVRTSFLFVQIISL